MNFEGLKLLGFRKYRQTSSSRPSGRIFLNLVLTISYCSGDIWKNRMWGIQLCKIFSNSVKSIGVHLVKSSLKIESVFSIPHLIKYSQISNSSSSRLLHFKSRIRWSSSISKNSFDSKITLGFLHAKSSATLYKLLKWWSYWQIAIKSFGNFQADSPLSSSLFSSCWWISSNSSSSAAIIILTRPISPLTESTPL